MDPKVTDTLLAQVPCMQFQRAESSKPTRFYLHKSVQVILRRKRKASSSIKTYAQASRLGPDLHGKKKKHRLNITKSRLQAPQVQHVSRDIGSLAVPQPANSAAALSLIRNPPTDQVRNKNLVPRMLAGIQDKSKRGRGWVTDSPPKRFVKVRRRVVGLNGCTVEDRVFSSKKERKRFLQQQRRAKEKVCDESSTGVLTFMLRSLSAMQEMH